MTKNQIKESMMTPDAAEDTGADAAEEEAPKTPRRRSQRRQESRKRLLEAARKLFVERGYHGTRPQDISREANVGHGTFYLHFEDKQDCFLTFVEDACDEMEAVIQNHVEGATDLPGLIRAILQAIHLYNTENPGVMPTALTDPFVIAANKANQQGLMDRWAEQWAQSLTDLSKAGAITGGYNYRVIGYSIVGIMAHGSRAYQVGGMPHEEVIDQLTKFLVTALTTDPVDPGQK